MGTVKWVIMSGIEHVRIEHPKVLMEATGNHEFIRDWLVDDPSLRYRLRGALSTFTIEPPRTYDLGYSSRPFVDMDAFCDYFDLPIDPESRKGQAVAQAFLTGCNELREDVDAVYYQTPKGKPNRLETFAQLPTRLQLLATFKVIGRLYPSTIFTDETRRAKLKSYFIDRLAVPENRAEDILQGAAILYASEILETVIDQSEPSGINTSRVDIKTLAGPTSPDYGNHLGPDLEQAVSKSVMRHMSQIVYAEHLLEDELPFWVTDHEDSRERYQNFWPNVSSVLDVAFNLTTKPEEEREVWRSYLFGKAVFAKAFERRRSTGFDGGLDQFVSWEEPIADKEYKARMETANQWLAVANKYGLDIAGLDLARQSFAIETIDQLETELTRNTDENRGNRINAVARLLSEIQVTSPELTDVTLEHSPLLRSSLIRAMDPWGYKFSRDQ
jgi:hypothetical protein